MTTTVEKTQATSFNPLTSSKVHYEKKSGDPPVTEIAALLLAARKSIMLSTSLGAFFEQEQIENAFKEAAENVSGSIWLLLDPTVNWEDKKQSYQWLTKLEAEEKVVVRQSKENIEHRLIVDKTHIRLEKEHSPNPTCVSNSIIYNAKNANSAMIKLLLEATINKFQIWWNNSTTVKKD